MGEAGRKARRTQAFLKVHPMCCYCGGHTRAATLDHVPSRQMFLGKRRPKGMEVPACGQCNRRTGRHEQVAAMLGRIYPSGVDIDDIEETRKIINAIGNNNPGLLTKLIDGQGHKIDGALARGRTLNCGGPLLNENIHLFGVKLGLAFHYNYSKRIVP